MRTGFLWGDGVEVDWPREKSNKRWAGTSYYRWLKPFPLVQSVVVGPDRCHGANLLALSQVTGIESRDCCRVN